MLSTNAMLRLYVVLCFAIALGNALAPQAFADRTLDKLNAKVRPLAAVLHGAQLLTFGLLGAAFVHVGHAPSAYAVQSSFFALHVTLPVLGLALGVHTVFGLSFAELFGPVAVFAALDTLWYFTAAKPVADARSGSGNVLLRRTVLGHAAFTVFMQLNLLLRFDVVSAHMPLAAKLWGSGPAFAMLTFLCIGNIAINYLFARVALINDRAALSVCAVAQLGLMATMFLHQLLPCWAAAGLQPVGTDKLELATMLGFAAFYFIGLYQNAGSDDRDFFADAAAYVSSLTDAMTSGSDDDKATGRRGGRSSARASPARKPASRGRSPTRRSASASRSKSPGRS